MSTSLSVYFIKYQKIFLNKLQMKIKILYFGNLELDEKRMDQMKESYYSFDKFNKDLIKFQEEQDKLLADIDKPDYETRLAILRRKTQEN